MKVLIVLLSAFVVGCSSYTQSESEAEETFSGHLGKVAMSRAFCDGQPLKFYYEISKHYSFTCEDGRAFTLRKD
jgi:hypothetical protein